MLFAPTVAKPRAAFTAVLPVVCVLLCALVGAVLLGQTPAALRVGIGAAGDEPFVAGMYPSEYGELGGVFRWTTSRAQLRMPGTAFRPAMFLLQAYGDVDRAAPKRPMTLRRSERAIDVLLLGPGWRDYHLLIPGAGMQEAWDDPPLVLEIDPLPRLADDGRDKGFPVAGFVWLPFQQAHLPWPMLPPIALLTVAAAWVWQLDRRLNAPAAWRGLRVAAVIGVLALGVLVWASRSPHHLARTLPPLPWTIGLAASVLLLAAPRGQPHSASSRAMACVAVVLMLLGLVLFAWPPLLVLAGCVAALGLLLYPWPLVDAPAGWELRLGRRATGLCLAAIFLLALGLRLYRIDDLPYGLWRDEGRHALEALRMLRQSGYRPAYVESVDLPGLGLLPFSWAIGAWGIRPWTLRIATAIAGSLTIVPLYGLAALLTGSRVTALLAALLLAASHWSIALSRFGFPTVFDPLLQLTALWLLLHAITGARPLWHRGLALLGAGVCLGLAAQTYHTGRTGLLVAGAFALSYCAANRGQRRHWPIVLGLIGVGFLIAAYPLIDYAVENPSRFSSRLGSVSLLGAQEDDWHSPLGKLDRSLGAHIMMWWARGDQNGRHVAPGRPMVDPVTGLGLLVGLALAVRTIGDWRKRCLLLGLLLGLLPSALAVEYPHAMRSVDALGFACALAALGLVAAGRTLTAPARRGSDTPVTAVYPLPALWWSAICGTVLVLNAWVYFVAMPPDRAVWTAVYPYHTQVGGYLRRLAGSGGNEALHDLYVPAGLIGNEVYDFLAYDLQPKTYQADTPAQAAPGSRFIVLGTLEQPAVERLLVLQHLDPLSGVAGPALPDGSRPAFVVYRVKE